MSEQPPVVNHSISEHDEPAIPPRPAMMIGHVLLAMSALALFACISQSWISIWIYIGLFSMCVPATITGMVFAIIELRNREWMGAIYCLGMAALLDVLIIMLYRSMMSFDAGQIN